VAGGILAGVAVSRKNYQNKEKGRIDMNNVIYIVGLVVVVLFIAGYLGLR